ncbi:hypothetical protein RM545_17175 [Zunongwangia sp. F260]|uniref:Lipoprotein n=1 Tax=Autumnicola lenta TaxID=3075593 RepID=A0ABU3CPZ4_9FLAO|nr:DUF6591 domain-containing protein [Zunongwangia sp. F260]MDT0648427.1 hypothetical protein [Zunongwangia sp. F260]
MKRKLLFGYAASALILISCGDSGKEQKSTDFESQSQYDEEIADYEAEMDEEMADFEADFDAEMKELDAEIEKEIGMGETDSNKSAEIDAALDSYEDYVDEYIVFLKKAHKGDASAMQQYPALMQKANDMNSKVQGMSNEFNSKQMARLTEIAMKMNKAAAEMQAY